MSNFKLILTSIKKIQFMVQLLNGFVLCPLDVVMLDVSCLIQKQMPNSVIRICCFIWYKLLKLYYTFM